MEIIDFHAHIYPEKIASKATAATGDFYKISPAHTGTGEELLSAGRKAGITRYVILPVATRADQVRNINTFIYDEAEKHKEFYGFGTIHPDCENKAEEVQFIIDSGLHGIKLHPDTQQFNTDDKRLYEVFDMIKGKLPVLIHCGDKRFDYSHPRRLKKIIREFPRLQVIAAHLGGWSIYEQAVPYMKDRSCYMDISSTFPFIGKEKVFEYIRLYGAERLLFGSDFPMWHPVKEYETFMELKLSEEERKKILWQNSAKVFDIDCSDFENQRI